VVKENVSKFLDERNKKDEGFDFDNGLLGMDKNEMP